MMERKLIQNDLQALQSLCETHPDSLRDVRIFPPEDWRNSTLREVGKNVMRLCSKYYECSKCPLYGKNCYCFRFALPNIWGHYTEGLEEF